MKRFLSIILITIMLFIAGCYTTPSGYTYELDMSYLDKEMYVEDFDISDLRLIITDSNGNKGFISLNESMLDDEEIGSLKQPGKHVVTISYEGYEKEFEITLLEGSKPNPDPDPDPDPNPDPDPDPDPDPNPDPDPDPDPEPIVTVFASENPYYLEANGYTGEELKASLRVIISKTKKKETYDDLRTDLAKTDADPEVPGNIILMYTGKSVSAKWDSGKTWNREHVWAKSLGWFKNEGAGADLHHIKPTNPSVNSSRGNKKFGSTTNSSYYEPRDEVKGDIARIIFYLMVRYKESDSYTFKSIAESKELLLSWNELDPVDTFEMNRNEVAYSIQGNRNPFIDHPECAILIWGTTKVVSYDTVDYIIDVVYYIDKKNRYVFV